MRTLVVYYSRTGNTKFVAEKIGEEMQAEVEELLEKKERKGFWGYLSAGRDALKGSDADLHDLKKDPAEYDLIFIGTPNWAAKIPPAIRTYLIKHSLEGKRVVLFCTQGGTGAGIVFNGLRRLIPKAEVISEKFFNKVNQNKDKVSAELVVWLESLKK